MKPVFEANVEDELSTTKCENINHETMINIDMDQDHGTIPSTSHHEEHHHRPPSSSANNNDDASENSGTTSYHPDHMNNDNNDNNNTNTNSINIDTDNGNRTNTGDDVTRSRNSLSSILNLYSNADFFFDCNTFKQVKRLYSGMLLVAMAYSITMVIMMVVLYKSIPDIHNHLVDGRVKMSPSYHQTNHPTTTTNSPFETDHLDHPEMMESWSESSAIHATSASPKPIIVWNNKSFSTYFKRSHQTRTHLDQVISINFLTSILYLMAFYAAQRELYNLTVAFTTMLAISMIVSLVRIISEGAHFPNNLMGLLLRMSIVFVAMIYSSQIRRKQIFLTNGNPFWLNDHRIIGRSNNPTTVQWINDMLDAAAIVGDSNKTDEHLIREYQDKPPGYEEALRCPVPNVRPVPTSSCPQVIYPKPGQ